MEEMFGRIEGGQDSDAAMSREPSPSGAGEGRRLGDSSRSGLSGLSAAGPVHQAGVGGLASLTPSQEASVDDANPSMSMSMKTSDPVFDEGIGNDVVEGPPAWSEAPGWGFDLINSGPPNNSDNDEVFGSGSQDSTRVEGGIASRRDSFDDEPMFSDHITAADDDTRMRGVRESAPPPDVQVTTTPIEADDEDDELPVTELRPGDDGDMDVSFAPK